MARVANRFVDPTNGQEYAWEINHNEEEAAGKTRNITHRAPTGNVGLVRQQADESPLVLRYKGSILTKAQLTTFIDWYKRCKDHSINFFDFAGDGYEVLITSFQPIRRRTIRNPRDLANAPMHYWEYTIEMEVLRVIQGTWAGVTP